VEGSLREAVGLGKYLKKGKLRISGDLETVVENVYKGEGEAGHYISISK